MCGIAAIISLKNRPIPDAVARMETMLNFLQHRGPDGQGYQVINNGNIILGATRLAITDPKANIPLPFVRENCQASLAFNGEIYNHRDLRHYLESKNYKFRFNCDTEVLYHGLQWNPLSFLQKIDGPFAFIYHDPLRNTTTLARDVMGERHLFYAIIDNELVCASELNPLLSVIDHRFHIDPISLCSSLVYSSPAGGKTLLRNVYRLKAGFSLSFNNKEVSLEKHNGDRDSIFTEKRIGQLKTEKWTEFFRSNPTIEKINEVYESEFYTSSILRKPDEVDALWTFSGGIDSTVTALLMSNYGRDNIATIFADDGEPGKKLHEQVSEMDVARTTSKLLGFDHSYLSMNTSEILPDIIQYTAENSFDGVLDPAIIPFMLIGIFAKQSGAKVLMLSDGPDELLGGYHNDYLSYLYSQTVSGQRGFALKKTLNQFRAIRAMLKLLALDDMQVPERFSHSKYYHTPIHQGFTQRELNGCLSIQLTNEILRGYGESNIGTVEELTGMDLSQNISSTYAETTLPDLFNYRSDKALAAVSIEARLPNQAKRLVELMLSTPGNIRYGATQNRSSTTGTNFKSTRFTNGKWPLRQICKNHVGPDVSEREKYHFSAELWDNPKIKNQLNIEETINSSDVFDDIPIPGLKKLANKRRAPLTWQLFSLALINDRLKKRDYSLRAIPY
jgi:asparagine synthase (glutamine-hydrolysing)